MLSIGDGVADDTLEESLEDSTGFFVDHGGNTLDTTTTSETSDSGLSDTLDVVTKNLSVTLGTALAEALAALAACWRCQLARVQVIWAMIHDAFEPWSCR